MHRIIFKELEFRNFMSYGNTLNRFEFRDGLTWLHGDNGFGKSAIVEAMTFALLGISYRGGKKEELRNTKNLADGAPTVVVLTFDLDSPPAELETYRVTRSITGKQSTIKLVIEKMVDGVWVAQNKRAGFSQQDFEERVLQFNEVLFKNVIAMNTQETLPFFMLPAAKKRELLESIIAMSLDTWKKENHKRLSEATMSFTLAKNDMVQLNGEIDELNKIYTRMQEEKSVNLSQMKADLETCNATIAEEQGQVDKLTKKRDKIVKGLTGIKAELDTEGTVDARIVEIRTQFTGVSNISQARRAVAEAQYEYDELYGQHSGIIGQLDEIRERIGERTAERNKAIAEKGVAERSISKKETEVEMTTAKRDKFAEQAKTFVVGTPCPTCGHVSDESDVERHKNALREQWKEANQAVRALGAEIEELNVKVSSLGDYITEIDDEISDLQGKIDDYNKNVYPDIHAAEVTLGNAKRELARYEKYAEGFDEAALTDELNELEEKKKGYPALRERFGNGNTMLGDVNRELGEHNGQLTQLQEKAKSLSKDIERAESNTDDAIAVMEGKIEKNKGMLNDAVSRMRESSDRMAICNTITKVCADDGMKKMVFSMFVPAFNKAVQRNLAKANLPFIVTFSDSMDYKFETLPGLSPSYTMLSQGQKRKLGFAISMAFRDFVSLVGNFNVNFLSLDEVLDISTDDNSMRDMLDLAKLMLADIGCAVIITHRGKVVSDKFDFQQEVTNNGMYSMLGDLKPMWAKDAVQK